MRIHRRPAECQPRREETAAMAMAVSMSTVRRRHAAAGVAAGEWAAVSGAGTWRVEEVGKQQLMRRTGLPPRDLRALDPALSCPSGILGRERAVVVRLEQVRAIVTASEVLVPSPHDPGVKLLVRELRSRLASTRTPTASPLPSPAPPQEGEASISITSPPVHGRKEEAAVGSIGKEKDRKALCCDKELPFEFRALEVCLEFACKSLEHETSTLEKEAYPALDELTSKVSTLNLERVRQIKSRLVAISGRVQKIRDELEHLLDDEMDMAAMHLTEKLAYQAVQSSRFDSTKKKLTEFDEESDGEVEERTASEGGRSEASSSFVGFRPNIDELEILLEAYFVHIDGTLNKLSTLREYVEDTEDYINIMLDDKQNQLLQLGILLSTATLVLNAAIAVTGVFGINIHIPLYEAPTNVFWQTTYGLVGGSVALYIIALIFYKRSGILQ